MKTRSDNSQSAIRVAQVGPSPEGEGGMASVIHEYLTMKNSQVISFSVPTWGPATGFGSLGLAFVQATKLFRTRRDWDVAHVHLSEKGSFFREGGFLLLARVLGKPSVASLHGANFDIYIQRFPLLTKSVLSLASGVICLGSLQKESLLRLLPSIKAYVVMNPVTIAQNTVQRSPKDPNIGPVALFAGVVGDRKGTDRLIAAWKLTISEVPSASLQIAGPDPTKLLDKLDTRNIPGIKILGSIPRVEVLELLQNSDIAVLPSRAEVMPMFILEALAHGIPVISTDVGQWQDLESAPGLTFIQTRGNSESQIITKLHFEMTKALKAELQLMKSKELINWVRTNVSADVISQKLTKIYLDLLTTNLAKRKKAQFRQTTTRKTQTSRQNKSKLASQ